MKNLVSILFLILSLQICAKDIVRMKNGDVFKGIILKQKMGQYVQIQDKNGNEKRLNWKLIDKIEKEKLIDKSKNNNISEYGKVGKTLFLGTWAATVGYCLASGSCGSSSYLPIIGPILANSSAGDNASSSTKTLGVISSLVQLLGASMWYGSISNQKKENKLTLVPQLNNNKIQLFAFYNF